MLDSVSKSAVGSLDALGKLPAVASGGGNDCCTRGATDSHRGLLLHRSKLSIDFFAGFRSEAQLEKCKGLVTISSLATSRRHFGLDIP